MADEHWHGLDGMLDLDGKLFEVTGKASPDKYDAAYLSGSPSARSPIKVPYPWTGQPC